ncbi:MAG: NPCBM/NEW2 domain-containing protein [Phycisphaerae bacterium]|nr:NPCBM/NEW2 domain-containing protein [Phycisphaerae bacterium]
MTPYRYPMLSLVVLLPSVLAGPAETVPADSPPATRAADGPVLRIAYFVPKDRTPIPGYPERLDRAVTEVQQFYRKGMEQNGHGPLTFTPDRNKNGSLRIHVVQGARPMREYGRDDSDKVRREVKAAMAREGVNLDRETVLIFEVLLDWQGERAIEVGPYCGGGDHRSGTAWVFDDARIDPRKLGDRSPGGYYGRPCSIGEFNSHYLGGIAHELGHALGLPHDREAKEDPRGHSLMGNGNHTFGEEQRGEGRGTFLSPASALPLAGHPLFTGKRENASGSPSSTMLDVRADFRDQKLHLAGQLDATPPAYGVVAYNDWTRIRDDYDALGATSPLDKDGRFHLAIGELTPGHWELRLAVCHKNGSRSTQSFEYEVASDGKPDLSAFREAWLLGEAVKTRAAGDPRKAESMVARIEEAAPAGSEVRQKAAHLRRLCQPPATRNLATIPADARQATVSELAFSHSSVGWGRPLRDEVIIEGRPTCFLQVNGQFYPSGLFAHAPARYALPLDKKWTRFRSRYGLQDGHGGSVVFVVNGDGKELFRSTLVKDQRLRNLDVDVSGVGSLELVTEDGGDGPGNDWGVWIEPRLER